MIARLACFAAALVVLVGENAHAEVRVVTLPGPATIVLLRVGAGDFVMGDDKGNPDERPAHRVSVPRDFWLGQTEVTQAQWTSVMGTNPSEFKGPRRPVENVNWVDAHEFLRRLNSLPSGFAFRLPTEVEWEYACRAGSVTRYSHGDDAGRLGSCAWFRDNSGAHKFLGWLSLGRGLNRGLCGLGLPWRLPTWGTSDVASKKANAWGFYDMHGSAWEWCEDLYAGGPQAPLGPGSPEARVIRGGSWFSIALDCRSSNRSRYSPAEKSNVTGLRLAADARP